MTQSWCLHKSFCWLKNPLTDIFLINLFVLQKYSYLKYSYLKAQLFSQVKRAALTKIFLDRMKCRIESLLVVKLLEYQCKYWCFIRVKKAALTVPSCYKRQPNTLNKAVTITMTRCLSLPRSWPGCSPAPGVWMGLQVGSRIECATSQVVIGRW